MLLLLASLGALSAQTTETKFQSRDIIYDTYYANTDYAKLVDGVFTGMNFAAVYGNAEACRLSITEFMNGFHFMYNNHTAQGLGAAERMFNVTALIAGPFAKTFFQCTTMITQAQQDIIDRRASFLDMNDFLTSALFNMLSKSIDIRTHSIKLIDYNSKGMFVEWVQSACVIVKSLIYFESSSASLDPSKDPDSPYYVDSQGNLMKKEEVDSFISTWQGPTREAADFFVKHGTELARRIEEGHRAPPMVAQTSAAGDKEEVDFVTYFQEITALQVFHFWFGAIDGALNAFPAGGFLYYCGQFSEAQRNSTFKMYDAYVDRNFKDAVYEGYAALVQTHKVSLYCYYGFLDLLSGTEAFYQNYNFLDNVAFNIGFMWTDLIMLLIGRPGKTDKDYFYYLAFYLADFALRFVFKESSKGYCWLPWNKCDDIVKSTVVVVKPET